MTTTPAVSNFVEVAEGEGTYTFVPLEGNEDENLYDQLAFLAQYCGKRHLTSHHLRAWALIWHVWAFRRIKDEKILGFLTTQPVDSLDIGKWNKHLPPEEKISVVDPILLLSDILVDPFFRRQTIASTMLDWAITRERYGEGDEDVYTTSFAISRIGEDGDTEGTSFGPLVRTGFREIQRIPYFYREASEDLDNWVCVPKCNPLREPGVLCTCTGVLLQHRREGKAQ